MFYSLIVSGNNPSGMCSHSKLHIVLFTVLILDFSDLCLKEISNSIDPIDCPLDLHVPEERTHHGIDRVWRNGKIGGRHCRLEVRN